MKRFFSAILLVLQIGICADLVQAQTVEKLKLKRFYRNDHLDVQIEAIGKDCNLRFIYDYDHLHRYKIQIDPETSKLKTVGAVLDMLEYMDEKTSERTFYFGTDDFDHVWEKLIDKAFGEKNKDRYFPRTRWLLDFGKYKEKHPLMPDSIMIYNGKYYVLDAKCYRYGWTGIPDHLPNASSISKQVTYGEYLEKAHGIGNDSLFNAFIMPYNMQQNLFGLTEPIGTIGEAVSDWKTNKLNYERIQGIVIDTRYLMYHYTGNPIKGKVALADCIEAVLKRPEVPPRSGR